MKNQILTFYKLIVIRPDAISDASISALTISLVHRVQRLPNFNLLVILVGYNSGLAFRALLSDIYFYHNTNSASNRPAHGQHGCIFRGLLFESIMLIVLQMISLKLYESDTLTTGYLTFWYSCYDIGSCGLTE